MCLLPYQDEFVANLWQALDRHQRVMGVMPTGGGKTSCFTEMTRQAAASGQRVMLIAHRSNIVEQIGSSLERAGVAHGWVMPGQKASDHAVQVGMVQSVARRLEGLPASDFIIFDEAHHVGAKTYLKIIDAYPQARILGVTATPIGKGLGEVFRHLTLGPSMRWLIERNYLADYVYYAPKIVANIHKVRMRAGDFAQEEAEGAIDQNVVTGDAVEHYGKLLRGKPAIAFCHSVAHAEHVAEKFRDAGWQAASVDGAMAKAERDQKIRGIGDGTLNVLTSCELISEGTDIPSVQGAILLRVTYKWAVYGQQVGRVLRRKPDGSKAIICDHVGNAMRLGLPDLNHEWSLNEAIKKTKPPPVRQCPACYAAFPPSRNCPCCGHEFWRDQLPRRMPQEIEGELEELRSSQVSVKKTELLAALYECRTLKQVHEVARRFRKTSGWAYVQWNLLCRYRSGAVVKEVPIAPNT